MDTKEYRSVQKLGHRITGAADTWAGASAAAAVAGVSCSALCCSVVPCSTGGVDADAGVVVSYGGGEPVRCLRRGPKLSFSCLLNRSRR